MLKITLANGSGRAYNGRMTTLKLSGDRKVTNAVTKGGSVKSKNSFGLPAGLSCPGMTSECETVCYARRTEKQYKGVSASVMHNWELLRDADMDTMVSLLSNMIDQWRKDTSKVEARPVFRIHWDGDFFSMDYAEAWATVIRNNADVQFWAYTRSFGPALNVVPVLSGIPNLSLYLSVDSVNREHVAAALLGNPGVRIATLSDYTDEGSLIVKEIRGGTKPGAACPENVKRIPLITEKGGACFTCKLCIDGTADVRFSRKKKERA